MRHPQNCSACHGGLSIWHDTDAESKHYGEVIALRFAHALTSWTSHEIELAVRCERCHHPASETVRRCRPHRHGVYPDGASLFWSVFRNPDPNAAAPKDSDEVLSSRCSPRSLRTRADARPAAQPSPPPTAIPLTIAEHARTGSVAGEPHTNN
jgi:hypothetical protein